MKQTTKAKVIALSVFGLALASAPLSMVLNAPEAKAGSISVSSAVAPLPPPPPSSDYFGENEVWDVDEAQDAGKARPAPKKARRVKTAKKTVWTCKRVPLVQQGRPGARTVLYCDHQ